MRTKVIPWHIALSKEFKLNAAHLYSLGIYSEKAAKLLNYLVWNDYGYGPTRWETQDGVTHPSYVRGHRRSKLTRTDLEFFIKGNGEVFVYVNNVGYVSDGTFTSKVDVILPRVKSMLAYALKAEWMHSHVSAEGEPNGVLKFEDHKYDYNERQADADGSKKVFLVATFNEYRALYETLLGRDAIKIVRNSGQEAVDSMVGHPAENEFAVNAVNIFEEQIIALKHAWNKAVADIGAEYQRKINDLNEEKELKVTEISDVYKAKLSKLEADIEQMKKAAV